jgi:hypothetical protein
MIILSDLAGAWAFVGALRMARKGFYEGYDFLVHNGIQLQQLTVSYTYHI